MTETGIHRTDGTPIHVVMVSKACVIGAYQKKLEEIAAFPDIRLTVIVPESWAGHRLERVYTTGYDLIPLPIRQDGNFHLFRLKGLEPQLKELAPDLIHADEEPYNLITWQIQKTADSMNVPTLFFSWQNLLRRYPFPFSAFERAVCDRARYALVGNSEAVNVWRQKGYDGPIDIIPQFGVDEALFSPAGASRPDGPFTIGYAGRLVAEKGLDLIIRAAARLQGDWRLVFLGSGPEEERLNELAGLYNMGPNVRFAGSLASTEMPAYYRMLDAFILPSLTQKNWKEQFGRVLIEAMACGVPVIGSDSGAIPEVIGPAGLVFAEGDVDALAVHIQRLMNDPSLRQELSKAGRRRVLSRFTQKKIAEDTVHVYRSIMDHIS